MMMRGENGGNKQEIYLEEKINILRCKFTKREKPGL
jgi:hypothetical protein